MAIKGRAITTVPAHLQGDNGVSVTKSGRVYTVAPDFDSLTAHDPLSASDYDNFWIQFYNSAGTPTYQRLSVQTLLDAIEAGLGDLAVLDTVGTSQIDDGAVTYAKIQDVSATSRILARKSSGAGSVEESTISEILDFIGSTAQGDVIYRGSSGWSLLSAGTDGQFLKTQGAAADPVWDDAGTILGSVGSDDGGIPRADDTGGVTLQSSLAAIDDSGNIHPKTSDTGALGTTAKMWSDLFLASGGVINFANGNYTVTHSTGLLTFSGPVSLGTSNAFTCGSIELGAASDTTVSRSAAGVIAVEGVPLFPNIPQNSQSAAYTTVLTDAGKHILHPTSDDNARTFTIAANASVAYPVGTFLTFINLQNTVTIAITSDTLIQMGTGSTGSRTLAENGIATAVKVGTTTWIISGTGLT